MEGSKQITENKITYSEILKAVDKLPEEEKEMILNFMKVEELRNILNTCESADKYSMDLLAFARFYAFIADVIQRLSGIIRNPESEVDVIMKEYDSLGVAEKKEIATNLLCRNEFLENAHEYIRDGFNKWTNINPNLKALTGGLLKLTESCVKLMKYNHMGKVNE